MCSSLHVQVYVILFLLWSWQLGQVLVCGVWLADFLNKKQLSLSSTVIIVTMLGLSVLRCLRLSGSCFKLWGLRSLESWGLKPWSYLCNNLQVTYGYRYKTDLSLKSFVHSSGAVWESRWTFWAVRPNEPSGFRGRKDLLNRASALVTTCP